MRDCENCKHRVMKVEVGKGTPPDHFWGCERWECEFEPTTKNDLAVDCISRADAIKAMQDKAKKLTNEDTINGLCGAVAILFDLPSVTQEPRKGHWEQYGYSWEDKFKCSECGKEQPKILCGEKIIGHWSDYCPNCGCRMVEPQESEDKE